MLRQFLVYVFIIEVLAVQLMLSHRCSAQNSQIIARICTEENISIYLI